MNQDDVQAAWDQLAQLTPALKSGIGIYKHQYRGVTWFLLNDPLSGQHFRCTAEAHRFLMLLDGQRTVADAFQLASSDQTESGNQLDVMRLFTSLHAADLLQGGPYNPDEPQSHTPGRWAKAIMRPFAIPFPLFDPDRFLTWLLPMLRPVFSRPGFILWMLLTGWAVSLAALSWPALVVHWHARFSDPYNLLMLLMLYPLVKGLHELGHGLAVKNRGGETHEMGIMLLIFVPVPYIDASSANAFFQKQWRMLVSAAGIMVELFLAAIAILLWDGLSPGLMRDLCFNVAFIGSISTLLFNGNPLLRFDAYYVLEDLLEIPNLGTRSTQYLGYLLRRYLLGLVNARSPATADGEKGWLLIYGLLSGIYRLFISAAIALLVAGQYFIFGILLAVWFVFMQILLPLVKNIFRLIPEIIQQGAVMRSIGVLVIFCGLGIHLVFIKSFDSHSYAEGTVVIPTDALVRAGVDGFVAQVLVENGRWIEQGETLFLLENPELDAQLRIIEARQSELRARHSNALGNDRVRAAILKIELESLQAEFDELESQSDSLAVVSTTTGRFALDQPQDPTGRYVKKGDLLGYVVNLSLVEASVIITQEQLIRIRGARAIEVRLASEPGLLLRGEFLRAVPLAVTQLPNRMLGSQSGGRIAVDARDKTGLTTMDPVFQLDIGLPVRNEGDYLGQSLVVRFTHSRAPIADQFYDFLRGQLLQRFNF